MAEPYLICPDDWIRGTLEPNRAVGLIESVDSGSTPSTGRDDFWDGGIPWLTPKEVARREDGMYVSITERTLSEIGLASCSAKLHPPGTVMLTKRAPVGAVAVNVVPMATNQGFLNFHCGPLIRPLYFAFWLKVNRPYLELVANGSTYPELYLSDLFEFELAVPSLGEQDKVLEFISALQFVALLTEPLQQSITVPAAVVSVQQQNQRLRDIRNTILPMLFSGEMTLSKEQSL
jgi:type I restriction enzyme S subunit